MEHGDKLLLIVREDLHFGAQAVQAAHALRTFTATHPEIDQRWYERSNFLALLAVPNEAALVKLLEKASAFGYAAAAFYEPDLENSLTAIALEPAARKLVRGLPLALRQQAA